MEKTKENNWKVFILAIVVFFLVLLFNQYFLNLASTDFIGNYLIILAISLFALGFIALEIKGKRELKRDLLNASLYSSTSLLFAIIHLAYGKDILLNISFATLSIWAFLGGFIYFFLILIKERVNL